MTSEDKGLVFRGLLLLTLISGVVAVVLTILLWRPQAQDSRLEPGPEVHVAAFAVPEVSSFPAGISWLALHQAGETLPSAPGFDIRYNAAATLARRGSADVPWDLIREMLNEKQQRNNNRVRHPDGAEICDEAAARATILTALRAVAAWHEKQASANPRNASADLREIRALVNRHAESSFIELKTQAEKTRALFPGD